MTAAHNGENETAKTLTDNPALFTLGKTFQPLSALSQCIQIYLNNYFHASRLSFTTACLPSERQDYTEEKKCSTR